MRASGNNKVLRADKEPLVSFVRTRLPVSLHQQLTEDARIRGLTTAKLMRAILETRYRNLPMPRVKAAGASYAVARELNRIGINLNQLIHLAHVTRVVPLPEVQRALARISAVIERL